jgi:LCP family protein required for cell wall assembly
VAGAATTSEPAETSDQAPPHHRRPRVPLLRKSGGIVLVVLLLLGLGAFAAFRYYEGRVERVEVPGLGDDEAVDGGAETFLIVGIDSREGLTDAQLEAIGTEETEDDKVLTDTIILVFVPRDGSAARFVSFPRDSWVDIPGHGEAKINSAYHVGEEERPGRGPERLVATIRELSGLAVDHYVEVGFSAFLDVTAAVGGVEVNLCEAVQESDSGIDLPAGRQRISGPDALAFVRQRQGLPGQDLGRIERQQYFLGAMTREILSAGTLLRPDRVKRLLDAVTDSLTIDEDLGSRELFGLAQRLRGLEAGAVEFQTVPITSGDATREGQSVVLLDEDALPDFFAEVAGERPPTPSPRGTATPTPTASPSPEPEEEPRTAADRECIN